MARSAKTATTTRTRRRRDWRLARWGLLSALVVFAAGLWFLFPYWELSGRLGKRQSHLPSRLYGRSERVAVGAALTRETLVAKLRAQGYREAGSAGLTPGTYRAVSGQLSVYLRRFPTARGVTAPTLMVADFAHRQVERLRLGGREVKAAFLEPPLIASFYGPALRERRTVRLDEVPEELIRAVLAAEDAGFFEHPGLSPSGIARALWANLRGRALVQGGSTLTQQLVKNLYLSPERTVRRKLREALLALLVEARYEKREILEAYLNDIFWGRSGSVNLIGVGAAAQAFFHQDASELGLAEAALLAGVIKAPNELSPLRHPEAALARRDWVLDRLAALGWAEKEQVAAAKASPLALNPRPLGRGFAPFFGDAMALEARRRFQIGELDDAGYTLLSTLDVDDQEAAEKALAEGLSELEKDRPKLKRGAGSLEAALVSLRPASGEILAWVGGRDYRRSQFDRVSLARRQAGSAFKPVVYAAAFETGVATPATLLEDAPLTVMVGDHTWAPANDDDKFRGWVTARRAVEQSLNVPTARLGLEVGPPAVVETAQRLGITTRLSPYPSIALGAFEVSPLDLATVYATLANGGVRPPVHGLAAVLDAQGEPLEGEPLPAPVRAVTPQTAYILTSILQGVLDRGTAASARQLGVSDPLAGKTGTTNGRRDNWFCGYGLDRASLVWVGYDDNSPTPLTGARAALPIWTRFARVVRAPGGPPPFPQPPGIVTAWIDPESGQLATYSCPESMAEVFREGEAPLMGCRLHGIWARSLEEIARGEPQRQEAPEGGFRRWWRRVFGSDRARRPGSPAP